MFSISSFVSCKGMPGRFILTEFLPFLMIEDRYRRMLRPCLRPELLPLKSWAGRVALRNSEIDPNSVGFCLGQSYCPVFLDITGVSH